MSEAPTSDLKEKAIEAIGKKLSALRIEQISQMREQLKSEIYGMTELARAVGVLDKRLTYSLEGHVDLVFSRREEPHLQPRSNFEW